MSTVTLHSEISGAADAPALLLGGSLGTTLTMWEPQVRELSSRLRTVAFDHRGHGDSPVPAAPYTIAALGQDVIALMDRLTLSRACYCGISIGGMVGQWLAVNHPDRIERLILIATSAHPGNPEGWHQRAETVRAAGTVETIADTIVSRWVTPGWAAEHGQEVRTLRGMLAATPVEGYAGCCEAIADFDLRGELSEITAPTLVISGADDPSLPPDHQRLIAAGVPGARLAVVDDAAHIPSIQHPAEVNDLILHHLDPERPA